MLDKFDELTIPRSTVESICQQEIGQFMVGFTWRLDIWRKPHKLIQVGLMQIVGAAIVFTVMMIPVDRLLNIYRSSQLQQERLTQLIWVDGTMTLIAIGGVNWYILHRGKQLQRLLKLVTQIEQYNQIVHSIATLEKVANLTKNQCESSQSEIVMEILAYTRQNLLSALQIERYLLQDPHSSAPSMAIAHNLINLQHLAQQPELAEYETLLAQAWEIGMSVYQETKTE
jgi:hypothetical protein